jgi:ATP-binding cassette subfamily C (CFTR/MRP) protein 1
MLSLSRWLLSDHTLGGSRVSKFVAQNLRMRQKEWSGKTQQRIAAITSILGSMKAIKAMGISSAVATHVTTLREDEISNANLV